MRALAILLVAAAIAASGVPAQAARMLSRTSTYAGQVTTVPGMFGKTTAVTFDPDHNLFYTWSNGLIDQITLSGTASLLCKLNIQQAGGLAYDSANRAIYATDTLGFAIWSVSPDCSTAMIAGGSQGTADGQGSAAQFAHPTGMALDPAHQVLYVADVDRIRAVTVDGSVTTFGQPGTIGQYGYQYGGQAITVGLSFDAATQSIYVADSTRNTIERIDGRGKLHPVSGRCVSLGPPQCQPVQVDGPNIRAGFAAPSGIVFDSADGALYVVESGNNDVRRLVPKSVGTLAGSGAVGSADGVGVLASFLNPTALAVDPVSGTMLVADTGNKFLRFITTQGAQPPPPPHGTVTFDPPTYLSAPTTVAVTADGSVWFDEQTVARIGRLTPAGKIVEYSLPRFRFQPASLVVGSDGAVWFSDAGFMPGALAAVARISATGTITEFPISSSPLNGMTLGPDGDVWFTDYGANVFGKVSPAGQITEYSPGYSFIAAGYDGNIWTLQPNFGLDQTFQYSTDGTLLNSIQLPNGEYYSFANGGPVTQGMWFLYTPGTATLGLLPHQGRWRIIPLPKDGGCQPFAGPLTLGADGNIWYGWGESCQFSVHARMLASVTAAGTTTLYPVYDARSAPAGMAFAPDGTLWFADTGANKIGKLY